MTSPVDCKIEQWKQRLLDLSRRNRLLFFRPSRYSTIQIVRPDVQSLFRELVEKEKGLRFPLPIQKSLAQLLLPEDEEAADQQVPVRRGDIEVNLDPKEMMRRLYRLRRDYRTSLVEQGVHTLFLALGILRWREASDTEEALAPIVLVPVTLELNSESGAYVLRLADEEITVNPTLSFKLEHDFGIYLPPWPEDATGDALLKYLNELDDRMRQRGWRVELEAWLGRFSFEKLVIYKDLDSHRAEAKSHPVVRALAGEFQPLEPTGSVNGNDLDRVAIRPEIFPILIADSSQTEVLLRAHEGHNLVVYGPPGTGKSQTIANLIAQFLREGKRVLFVSEKMAALEVVNRRLQERGLGPAILEIHSHRANRWEVIKELGTTLFAAENPSPQLSYQGVEAEFKRLRKIASDLNAYVRELHMQRDPQGRSAYQVAGKLAKLQDVPYLDVPLPWDSPLSVSEGEEMEAESVLNQMAGILQSIGDYRNHPFRGWQVANLPMEEHYRIGELLRRLADLATDSARRGSEVSKQIELTAPRSIAELRRLAKVARLLVDAFSVPAFWLGHLEGGKGKELLSLAPNAWSFEGDRGEPNFTFLRRFFRDVKDHQERLKSARLALEKLCGIDVAELSTEELKTLRERFRTQYCGRLRFLKGGYRKDMRLLRSRWRGQAKLCYDTALQALDLAISYREEESWLEQRSSMLSCLLGPSLFAELETDWQRVDAALAWAEQLYNHFEGEVPVELVKRCRDPRQLSKAASETLKVLEEQLSKLDKALEELRRYCSELVIEGTPFEEAGLLEVSRWSSERANNLSELANWARFQRIRSKCEALGLGPLVEDALAKRLPAGDWVPAFRKRFLTGWLSAAMDGSRVLAQFDGQGHENLIRSFRELDEKLLQEAARLTLALVRRRQTAVAMSGGDDLQKQKRILLKEINKKKRFKPLRILFSEIAPLLQALKPCLLMSPLSVSSYLEKGRFHFDVVIFDEASQIPPQDAICSILRANQVIVAGDDKQLPPTTFFQVEVDGDEEEESSDDELLDSILEECAAIPSFGRCRLRWHYRSRHEGLIAFSNREFYEGELITFPNPNVEEGGIRFVHVPNGIYDRGRSRTNREEARRVAQLVIEHFEQWGRQRSLGVIALSIAQERAIDEELWRLRADRPDLEAFFVEDGDEPFFVKNLENVQGDERDHIIISIGYGRGEDGRMTLNFGPINRAGGERRLNVAITRAKWQTTVVCSFLPEDLGRARLTTNSSGVIKLQRYLEYARSGRFMTESAGGGQPESEFEEAVRSALQQAGLQVDCQVGCSNFRIDLAVRHPDREGRYILGIECDGAQYHSARTARDRDRLRQQILEGLGWNILRIWCPDWLSNPKAQVRRVLDRVEDLRSKGVLGVAAPPPSRITSNEPLPKTAETAARPSIPALNERPGVDAEAADNSRRSTIIRVMLLTRGVKCAACKELIPSEQDKWMVRLNYGNFLTCSPDCANVIAGLRRRRGDR